MSELFTRLSKLETRVSNATRFGTVAEVDPKTQKMRLRLGGTDDKPFLSPWVPYGQTAGAMKFHNPPSVGQQFALLSDNGEMRQAVAVPMTWSDQNQSPSEKGDEHVMTYGDARIEVRGNEIVVKVPRLFVECGGTTFELTSGGLKAVAPDYQWD